MLLALFPLWVLSKPSRKIKEEPQDIPTDLVYNKDYSMSFPADPKGNNGWLVESSAKLLKTEGVLLSQETNMKSVMMSLYVIPFFGFL